jgi:hypothetical protein
MTISSYQVDNVIKTYSKQQRTKVRLDMEQDSVKNNRIDIVSLSRHGEMSVEAYTKISYNLLDILAKQKK